MATTMPTDVFEDVFKNFRKAAESNLKMQQEMFRHWGALWPGFPTPQAAWVEKVRDFQHQWVTTVSDLAHKHRDSLDKQYQAGLESLEEALRVTEASNPEELRERTEKLFRKTFDCVREISETQMNEFQDAISRWSELTTKVGK